MDTDATTLDRESDSLARRDTLTMEQLALVVVWSRASPTRVGEVVLIPDTRSSRTWTLGRGTRLSAHDASHLGLTRQRPGENIPTGPLQAKWISRQQLRLRMEGTNHLAVENIGTLSLTINQTAVESARVRDGDLLMLGRELALLCVRRAYRLPAADRSLHAFGDPDDDGLIGESPASWQIRDFIDRAARRSRHVLLQGESGVGKELIARAVHNRSERASGPLIARNAATIPEGLIDAELFGCVRGYPTSGTPQRVGLVGAADGGTLFLDEIGELPQPLQAHLLRLMDDGAYHRLGEAWERRADLRLIGATNRPAEALKSDIAARFALRLTVPGLSDRAADIPLLIVHLLRKIAAEDPSAARHFDDMGHPRLSPALVCSLLRHPYTGHVRELERMLWRAVDASRGRYLGLPDKTDPLPRPPIGAIEPGTLTRAQIVAALAECGGVKERAWRKLGLSSRFQLYRLLKEHDIG